MLTAIQYKNFKCFDSEISMPTSRVNLLTGVNGRGKSTMLQGLLLMRQSPEHSRTTTQIIFNGACVSLGSFHDIKSSEISRSEAIHFGFDFVQDINTAQLRYVLSEDPNDDMVAQIEELRVEGRFNGYEYQIEVHPQPAQQSLVYAGNAQSLSWRNLLFEDIAGASELSSFIKQEATLTKIHFVSADRIGPRDFYPKQSFGDFPNVGRSGEFTANILSKKGGETVANQLCLNESETNTVLDQAQAWLTRIFDGGRIKIDVPDANIVILSLNSERSARTYKPTNVGFGYSYVLPIIVSGLIAASGEILIVENPEAHLHPYAQSQLTKFLSKLSTIGVQVFIESHSEHILNGLRISVRNQLLEADDLTVLYFGREETQRITVIPVDPKGTITLWPSGFFDQTNSDYSRLFSLDADFS